MIRFIYLFLIYSFMGYLWEVLLYILKDKGFINRGELRGPWIFVYGLGGVIISYIISNYDDFFMVFIMSILFCGALEYIVSLIEEIVFKRRWWDYSHMFMNINGRVCFISLLSFGFLGIVIAKYLTPFFNTLFYNSVVFNSIVVGIFALFLNDFIYSCLVPHDGKYISINVK